MTATKSTAATSKSGASVTLGGKKFTVTTKLPMRFARAVAREDIDEMVSILLGDQADDFWDLDLPLDDLPGAIEKMAEKTGASLGES